jgi:iron complex outermembrane recepter protein
VGVGVTLGATYLTNMAGTPDELRNASRSAYFTGPDNQRNSVASVDLRATHDLGEGLALQGSMYYRHLRIAVTNGNTSNNQACSGGGLGAFLCDGSGNQLFDRNGNAIAAANTYVINKTQTLTDGYGGALQTSYDGRVFGRDNVAIFGASVDAGDTRYISAQYLGQLDSARMVVPDGQVLGGEGNYVAFLSHNIYTGVYASDVLTVMPGLDLTVSGRYNTAVLNLHDQTGDALNGTHYFDRLNPALGLTWKLNPSVTLFGNYSEANRIPTAAELSCASATQPCFVPNGFQADPSLGQVVSRSWENGARGPLGNWGHWSATGFFDRNANDIYFVADPTVTGSGFFRNIGNTQRAGFEGNLDGQFDQWGWFASYTLLRATFDSPMVIGSASPAAVGGVINVAPGKVIPGNALHSLKIGGSYQINSRVSLGADAMVRSGVFLRGDENNTQAPTNPYAIVNLDATWRATGMIAVYIRANNIFNQKYETAGQYGDGTGGSVFPAFSTNDRFLTSGMPANFWLGTRIAF